jgi:hypothetical protein
VSRESSFVSRLAVFVRRNEEPTVLSFTTDDRGALSLPDLPAASYWV